MGHTLHRSDQRGDKISKLDRIEQKFDGARDHFFMRILIPAYMRAIAACIRTRYFTLACAIAILITSIGMVAGGRLEFVLFEDSDSETINASLRMPVGTPTAVTDEYVRRVEEAFLAQPETKSAFAQAGAIGDINGEGNDASASHIGQVIVELIPTEQRDRQSSAIIQSVRDRLGEIPEIKSLRMDPVGGGPGGPAITLAVVGENPDRIDAAVKEIKQIINSYAGVENLSDDSDAGQRELRLSLRDGADEIGFTTEWLAQQVRGAVFGLEPHTFPGVREDVDVRVIFPPRIRDSLAAIEGMHVYAPDGRAVPLMEVARLEEERSYASIRRLDGQRVVQITADVNRQSGANPEQIAASVMSEIEGVLAAYPGVRIVERGRQKDTTESLSTLPLGMMVAAGLIYVILTWLFSSYAQPLVVMSAIPFALIGMIWGHIVLGYSMTFLSLIGFIALSGIVVNDSLIFVKFFNEKRAAGWTVPAAAMLAGHARMRAILLTTVTTVLGLTPLMLERSFQAAFLIPMAITISFGLISATGIILIVLPCLLVILDDVKRLIATLWTGRMQRPSQAEPAAG
jgi:multidrug efflux pump subunit AcrB